jgi:hypothetical protein
VPECFDDGLYESLTQTFQEDLREVEYEDFDELK